MDALIIAFKVALTWTCYCLCWANVSIKVPFKTNWNDAYASCKDLGGLLSDPFPEQFHSYIPLFGTSKYWTLKSIRFSDPYNFMGCINYTLAREVRHLATSFKSSVLTCGNNCSSGTLLYTGTMCSCNQTFNASDFNTSWINFTSLESKDTCGRNLVAVYAVQQWNIEEVNITDVEEQCIFREKSRFLAGNCDLLFTAVECPNGYVLETNTNITWEEGRQICFYQSGFGNSTQTTTQTQNYRWTTAFRFAFELDEQQSFAEAISQTIPQHHFCQIRDTNHRTDFIQCDANISYYCQLKEDYNLKTLDQMNASRFDGESRCKNQGGQPIWNTISAVLTNKSIFKTDQYYWTNKCIETTQGPLYISAGCFHQNITKAVRSLALFGANLTLNVCSQWCQNFTYIALGPRFCHCLESMPTFIETCNNCNRHCNGNEMDRCGSDHGHVSVYKLFRGSLGDMTHDGQTQSCLAYKKTKSLNATRNDCFLDLNYFICSDGHSQKIQVNNLTKVTWYRALQACEAHQLYLYPFPEAMVNISAPQNMLFWLPVYAPYRIMVGEKCAESNLCIRTKVDINYTVQEDIVSCHEKASLICEKDVTSAVDPVLPHQDGRQNSTFSTTTVSAHRPAFKITTIIYALIGGCSLIVLIVIVSGIMLGLFCYRFYRQKKAFKHLRGPTISESDLHYSFTNNRLEFMDVDVKDDVCGEAVDLVGDSRYEDNGSDYRSTDATTFNGDVFEVASDVRLIPCENGTHSNGKKGTNAKSQTRPTSGQSYNNNAFEISKNSGSIEAKLMEVPPESVKRSSTNDQEEKGSRTQEQQRNSRGSLSMIQFKKDDSSAKVANSVEQKDTLKVPQPSTEESLSDFHDIPYIDRSTTSREGSEKRSSNVKVTVIRYPEYGNDS